MDVHIALLLRTIRAAASDADAEPYVWWGKLRSAHRLQELPHLDDILALDALLEEDPDAELHFYLTDYRSLYVAQVDEITTEDVRMLAAEEARIPEYYRSPGKAADFWLKLLDIRLLVLDDTPAVIAELKQLRNVRYHEQPVSLYGGMLDLPLLVNRPDGQRYFDPDTLALLTEGRHWVEVDAERSGVGEMQQELRENHFGNDLWTNLDPTARVFVATAEQIYRAHRADAAFDLSPVIVNYAKCVEVQVNAVLRSALREADGAARVLERGTERKDLVNDGPFGLSELRQALSGPKRRRDILISRLARGEWFTRQLPERLEELRQLRNPAAHRTIAERDRAILMRNQLLGVGCEGLLIELAKVALRP